VVTGDDLHSASRAQSLSFGIDDESAISEIAIALFETLDTGAAVRHVGIHVRSLVPRERNVVQLSFNLGDDTDALKATAVRSAQASQAENDALRDTLDAIRDKFGIGSVGRGSALDDDGLHLGRQRGSSSFSATQTGEDLE
jgi:hypothetical protein